MGKFSKDRTFVVARRMAGVVVKSRAAGRRPAKQRHRAVTQPRMRVAEEFEADTQEDRSVAVLAEKRRLFLARLRT